MDFIDTDPGLIDYGIASTAPIDGQLEIDTYNTLTYGNEFDGSSDVDGIVSLTFEAPGGPLTLNLRGYDVDSDTEVAVLINFSFLGFLNVTENNSEGFSSFDIDASQIDNGTNMVTFVQTRNSDTAWGVTDIFLEGPGMHELPFYYDPEFTDDGWVGWQTDHDGFYLGRMDLDTGGFLGVVNYLDVEPITWFETVQAVEMIRTVDGVAALGMSEQGIIYLSETEAKVLEGTEGMRFAALPKGEVPSLRFICYNEVGLQFLYDDGELTALPVRDGQAWQWLNETEVLTRNDRTNATSILNVETGELTVVTTDVYIQGQAAAITTSTGEQLVTLKGDGYRDIYINDGDGWEFLQRMNGPLPAGDQFFSPEFVEWHGRVWISGYIADDSLGWDIPSVVGLYDIENDLWVKLTGTDVWRDPEVLVLNDGSLAWYADQMSSGRQFFDTISYDQAMKQAFINEFLYDGGFPLQDAVPRFPFRSGPDLSAALASTPAETGAVSFTTAALGPVHVGLPARADQSTDDTAPADRNRDEFQFQSRKHGDGLTRVWLAQSDLEELREDRPAASSDAFAFASHLSGLT